MSYVRTIGSYKYKYYAKLLIDTIDNNLDVVIVHIDNILDVYVIPNIDTLSEEALSCVREDLDIYTKASIKEYHIIEHGYFLLKVGTYENVESLLDYLSDYYSFECIEKITKEALEVFDMLMKDKETKPYMLINKRR